VQKADSPNNSLWALGQQNKRKMFSWSVCEQQPQENNQSCEKAKEQTRRRARNAALVAVRKSENQKGK
jgi:hypothetical protein